MINVGDTVWFRGEREAEVLGFPGSDKVQVRFVAGLGNERAVVSRQNIRKEMSAQARTVYAEMAKQMRRDQEILDRLKGRA